MLSAALAISLQCGIKSEDVMVQGTLPYYIHLHMTWVCIHYFGNTWWFENRIVTQWLSNCFGFKTESFQQKKASIRQRSTKLGGWDLSFQFVSLCAGILVLIHFVLPKIILCSQHFTLYGKVLEFFQNILPIIGSGKRGRISLMIYHANRDISWLWSKHAAKCSL